MKKTLLTAALFLMGAQSALFADIYNVTIDTSTLLGPGVIDIQFNPAPGSMVGNYQLGTATIRNFTLSGPGASLGLEEVMFRLNATGDLQPGPLSITNDDPGNINGVVYNATFGTLLTFELELSGLAYTSPAQAFQSDFSISLYGNGSPIVGIAGLAGNSTIYTALSDPQVTFALQSVPEPTVLWTLGAVPGVLLLLRRRRN
ncbi:hypothetical protein F183_A14030 [Bryobacterales bacterium F-183]|nr:hypothetical protein F183_A14030 [Bryobacterales bacterium F-183]